ncbi:MAG: ABC transporter substrate-binding protein, partial [Gammaproteobacteria bacterium]
MKWEVKALWCLMASVAVGLVALASAAGAAEPGAVRRIGALIPPIASQEDGLRQGLRDLGYIEGRNVVIEWRRWRTSSTKEELEALAADVARSKVELIVTSGTPAALAAARATTIPVVFLSADPVGTGLVESLSKPGRNSTGIALLGSELTAKRLELLKLLAPRARRIAYFTNSSNPLAVPLLNAARHAARVLGLQLVVFEARNAAEIDAAFRAIAVSRPGGILLAADFVFVEHKEKIATGVLAARLPAMSPVKEMGLVMSYGPDVRDAIRRTAPYV